ncbi:hypothetical protein EMGBS15_00810 [Filimonas sp.]|nr:hypothetical protein EMGBS15_00810 [Filimonas sp.]
MQAFLDQYFGKENIIQVEQLALAGSNRMYYRVYSSNKTFIACESSNTEENETFFYFSDFFKHHQLPVPQILHISPDRKNIYRKTSARIRCWIPF